MFSLNCNGKLLLIDKPLLMGVINLTEDSFYEGSRFKNSYTIKDKVTQMIDEGATIIDLGAQSTRPGSIRITANEELEKLLPVIETLKENVPEIIISIDTYHSKVAEESVKAGATIINDISAGEMDKNMVKTVAKLKVPFIGMHMKGVPETMQHQPHYEDIKKEILDFFIGKIKECEEEGINDIIIDPGFGFGKNISQNLHLLKHLGIFKLLEKPIMIGVSRKSAIYKTLKITAEESLNGTTVLNTIGLLNGASILRVHDVKAAKQAVTLFQSYSHA